MENELGRFVHSFPVDGFYTRPQSSPESDRPSERCSWTKWITVHGAYKGSLITGHANLLGYKHSDNDIYSYNNYLVITQLL